jgi:N-acylglucosamine-6-phosphate 2-epimerase
MVDDALRAHIARLDRILRGGLLVSCQPVSGGPMDTDEVVVRLAQAAMAGGADGLRIEGAARVALVRAGLGPDAPIVGLVKRDLPDSPVRITPWVDDVYALAEAGADVIAVDATDRPRPVSVAALREAIAGRGCLAMADCATLDDARRAVEAGFEWIGTTLSGYTAQAVPEGPDLDLVRRLAAWQTDHASTGAPAPSWHLIAEGRYDTPALAAAALQAGAWAVTVGTAITRTEVLTQWFVQALRRAGAAEKPSEAPNSGNTGLA